MKIEVIPFNDFWIDCSFNPNMSIICSIEPSYKYLAYLNNYTYIFHKMDINGEYSVNMISLDVAKNEYFDLLRYTPFRIENVNNCLEELKELIDKHIILISVDLFYWIPTGICWNCLHWTHLSIVNAYDDCKGFFSVIDDDIKGYVTHEIPYDRALMAMCNGSDTKMAITGHIVDFPMRLESYRLSLDEIYMNAQRLISELGSHDADNNLWDFKQRDIVEDEWLKIICSNISKITGRQHGNLCLFKALFEMQLIDKEMYQQFETYANNLKIQWHTLKGTIMKGYYVKKRYLKKEALNDKVQQLFREEKRMWEIFCDN